MTPGVPTANDPSPPGVLLARVKYDTYGRPTLMHPNDYDGDGWVGGSLTTQGSEALQDQASLQEALNFKPFDGAATGAVEPSERAWRALANVTGLPPPLVGAGTAAWNVWQNQQLAAFNAAMVLVPQAEQWGERFGNLPLFGSYWYDARLEIYHVRHRVYDPELGRWLQRDPIGYAGGDNLYGYVGEMPMGGVDPMGLFDIGEYVHQAIEGAQEASDIWNGQARARDATWQQMMSRQKSVSSEALAETMQALDELRDEEGRQIVRTVVAGTLALATLNPAVAAIGSGTAFGGGTLAAAGGGAGMGLVFDLASQTIELGAGYRDSFSWKSAAENAVLGTIGGVGGKLLNDRMKNPRTWVFYSGLPERIVKELAAKRGATTMSGTLSGAVGEVIAAILEAFGAGADTIRKAVWTPASAAYAATTRAKVWAFGDEVLFYTGAGGPTSGGIWLQTEKAILGPTPVRQINLLPGNIKDVCN